MGGSETDAYCTCGEENLLSYRGDPYLTENILIHEFAHNIHLRGLVNVDPTFDPRLQAAYQKAMSAGLWKGKYASVNHHEYFAEGVQSWFDNNREDDHDHNHVDTREELLDYDPELAAALSRSVSRYRTTLHESHHTTDWSHARLRPIDRSDFRLARPSAACTRSHPQTGDGTKQKMTGIKLGDVLTQR